MPVPGAVSKEGAYSGRGSTATKRPSLIRTSWNSSRASSLCCSGFTSGCCHRAGRFCRSWAARSRAGSSIGFGGGVRAIRWLSKAWNSALNSVFVTAPQRCWILKLARAASVLLSSRVESGRGLYQAKARSTGSLHPLSNWMQSSTLSANSSSTLGAPGDWGRMEHRRRLCIILRTCPLGECQGIP